MLYSNRFRTPSQKSKIDHQTFSFVDGFSDQKQQKTMANSISKRSDFETTSCCTYGFGTQYQRDQQEAFYSQTEETKGENHKLSQLAYGLSISKQINYSCPEQYQEQLENLLNDIKIDHQNKIYLRLIILDQLYAKDNRLQRYFQRAMQEYRQFKQNFFQQNFNSALGCCKKQP